MIRHEKIHCIRYPECLNWTIFMDFRPINLNLIICNLSQLWLFDLEPNFEPLPVLLHFQTPSKWIRHVKSHWFRYPECQNWTIFMDFRPWNLTIALHNLSRLWLFDFEPTFKHFPVLLYDQTPSQSIRHEKIHWFRYLERQNWTNWTNCCIGNLQVSWPKIHENGPILTFWIPKSMYF